MLRLLCLFLVVSWPTLTTATYTSLLKERLQPTSMETSSRTEHSYIMAIGSSWVVTTTSGQSLWPFRLLVIHSDHLSLSVTTGQSQWQLISHSDHWAVVVLTGQLQNNKHSSEWWLCVCLKVWSPRGRTEDSQIINHPGAHTDNRRTEGLWVCQTGTDHSTERKVRW